MILLRFPKLPFLRAPKTCSWSIIAGNRSLARKLLCVLGLPDGVTAWLIREYAVTGATSNPTIFAKAITRSDRYDTQLRRLADGGERDPRQLFFTIALDDVREAAHELRPVFDASGGRDGFVSFECTPDLADDTEATIAQASELWQRLNEPNVMIKVPGTEAGLPAIEELTRRGVNINVTLLFAIERYEQVIDAYLRGLAAHAEGASGSTRSRRSPRSSSHGSTARSTRSCPRTRRSAVASRSPTRASPTSAT
jgi:transaldolase